MSHPWCSYWPTVASMKIFLGRIDHRIIWRTWYLDISSSITHGHPTIQWRSRFVGVLLGSFSKVRFRLVLGPEDLHWCQVQIHFEPGWLRTRRCKPQRVYINIYIYVIFKRNPEEITTDCRKSFRSTSFHLDHWTMAQFLVVLRDLDHWVDSFRADTAVWNCFGAPMFTSLHFPAPST